MKSPVSDEDEDDADQSSDKMDSPPSGGRQKRAAALKQKGQKPAASIFSCYTLFYSVETGNLAL